ncbi:R3H domain-containing nucleic acid-binding protein [Leptodesmis sichuanensis]|uniref:R3H domain-containing nucleic acid-binding protein n=1 Tax=Leptodesmis sichuanensis TaxID=2906798 RepID=UPI001F3CD8FC|nr:R3H domain-containing nucleic acid-binding protein [Leptodesmis sichuanensis]UIE38254.1 AAA family ATPase [Leptodesmis sichuanensis A121]
MNNPAVNTQITDDLSKLLEILPAAIRQRLQQHPQLNTLVEVVLDLGRRPEARFPGRAEYLSDEPVTQIDINDCIARVGDFGGDNRAGIEQTLHRISAIRNRRGEIIGLTCRVGRAIFGTIGMIRDLVESGKSILMLGRPGVGKTTALREIARVLADDLEKRVVIIDTSNEIAGDGDVPHPAIGRARRMQVARPELQHQVMIEAVENHMPEVIVIDEIGTELEALAARTIAERGVQLVGTAHGNQLENLIKNPTLSDLVGGIQSVTLGDEEARRRGSQKSVLERKAPPTFDIAVEMLERQRWVVHEHVAETIDSLLRGRQPNPQVRTVSETGKVTITHELSSTDFAGASRRTPVSPSLDRRDGFLIDNPLIGRSDAAWSKGWRSAGQMRPLPSTDRERELPNQQQFEELWNQSLETDLQSEADVSSLGSPSFSSLAAEKGDRGEPRFGLNGEDLLYVYPYGVSRHQLDQVIQTLRLPVVLTKDIDNADAVLALRSHVKNHSKLRQIAKARQVPIHTVKSSSIPQIARGLRRMLDMDDPSLPDATNLDLYLNRGDSDDEIEALEEARLAVEQIVIPKGQPVELLPRSASVRKMQHELVEHYHLKSRSFGEEPNRRLRIYPA